MKPYLIFPALVLGVFSFAGLRGESDFQANGSAPAGGWDSSLIRFVDINEVVSTYEKAKKVQEEFRSAYTTQLAELQRREEELFKKKKELAPLNRDSQEYYQKSVELEIEQLKFQRDGDFLLKERERKRLQILISAYDDIREAVRKYAEANHLKMVFLVQKDSQEEGEWNIKEKSAMILRRQVLYYNPSLDATSQIIRILNAQ